MKNGPNLFPVKDFSEPLTGGGRECPAGRQSRWDSVAFLEHLRKPGVPGDRPLERLLVPVLRTWCHGILGVMRLIDLTAVSEGGGGEMGESGNPKWNWRRSTKREVDTGGRGRVDQQAGV